ncbi:MAG TPA: hypothetical protein VGB15_09630 [Longimicrobium sp.]|jgi:hypothetical protein
MRCIPSIACLSAALLLSTSGTAAAQAGSHVETRLGLELVSSGIEPVAADSAGIGSRAWGVQVTGSLIAFRVLSLNAEGGIIGMSDEQPFTQETNQGEKTSGVAAGMGTLSAGLRTPPLSLGGEKPFHLSAGVNAGRSWVDVNRDITYCYNCHAEDVQVQAGSFVEPVLQVGAGRGALIARYRMYSGDSDFTDALMLGYTISTRRPAPKPAEATEAPR